MSRKIWTTVLSEIEKAHRTIPDLAAFCSFPDDLSEFAMQPRLLPPAALMQSDGGLTTDRFQGLRDAFVAAGPHAPWGLSYAGTNVTQDFLDRFGYYAVIGDGGAFASARMWAWMVYMPAGLYYPWHHHLAEEAYVVVAGEGEFMRQGEPNAILGPGAVCVHQANQPHALRTHDKPVMCLVVWRNAFESEPVLTYEDAR